MPTVQKYYPPVSDLIDATALPGDLEAIEDLLQEGVDLTNVIFWNLYFIILQ